MNFKKSDDRGRTTEDRGRKFPLSVVCHLSSVIRMRQSPALCLGDAEEAANCFHELGDRNRLRQIGLAATLPYALLVAIHRKSRDGDNRDPLQLRIAFDPLCDLEPRNVGQLYVHQDQVGTMRTRKLERLNSAARPQGVVAM